MIFNMKEEMYCSMNVLIFVGLILFSSSKKLDRSEFTQFVLMLLVVLKGSKGNVAKMACAGSFPPFKAGLFGLSHTLLHHPLALFAVVVLGIASHRNWVCAFSVILV